MHGFPLTESEPLVSGFRTVICLLAGRFALSADENDKARDKEKQMLPLL